MKKNKKASAKSSKELSINRPLERPIASRISNKSSSSLASNTTFNSRKVSSAQSQVSYSLDHFINDIISRKFKKILVLTGAGISTPSGIPDFRTPGTGIYDNLAKFDVPYPEAIFEKEYFRRNPKPFFKIAKDLLPNKKQYKPNKIHYFIRLLQEKKILHRLYTQNIDSLETLAGIKSDKLIEAHGSFRSAKCTKCTNIYPADYVELAIQDDKIPICKVCYGIVKPDIVFFGEDLPEHFYRMYKRDFSQTDLVIVLGTSLKFNKCSFKEKNLSFESNKKVEPFASIIDECPKSVPRVLMNKNLVGPFKKSKNSNGKKDVTILGDLIGCLDMLIESVGWQDELDQLILREKDILERRIQIEEEMAEKNRQLEMLRNEKIEHKEKNSKNEKAGTVENIEKANKSEESQMAVKSDKTKKPERSGFITSLAPESTLPSLQNLNQKFMRQPKQTVDSNRSNKSDKDNDYFKDILDKYDKIRKGTDYSLSYGIKKIDMNESYNIFSNYKSKIDFITHKPPPAKVNSQHQSNKLTTNKVLDLYFVKAAAPIKFGNSKSIDSNLNQVDSMTSVEKYNDFCLKNKYQPPPLKLFDDNPSINKGQIANKPNVLYTANSKPYNSNQVKSFEPMLQISKINYNNIDILNVEKNNNDLIQQMREKCKC